MHLEVLNNTQMHLTFRLQDWYHSHKPSVQPRFHPYVNVSQCLPERWYKMFEKQGTARHMWSMWFIRYMHDEHIFCVYSNLDAFTRKRNVCLSVNMQEPGLHYGGKPGGRRTSWSLLKDWSDQYVKFPKNIARLHWDGRLLARNVYHLWFAKLFWPYKDHIMHKLARGSYLTLNGRKGKYQ